MKTHLMFGVAAAAMLIGAPASAQTAFDGFYAGAGASAQKASRNLDLTLTPVLGGASITSRIRPTKDGIVAQGRVFAGYNMSFDRWVVGGEVGYQPDFGNDRRNFSGSLLAYGPSSGLYTVIARGGYLVQPDLMVYAFGGWAGQQQQTVLSTANVTVSKSFSNGYTGGVGIEYALTSNLFLRGEAQYTDLGVTKGVYKLTSLSGPSFQGVARNSGVHYGGTLSVGYRF